MTALARYAKLESEARYFDGKSAQPRDVVLSFGSRTLTIMGADDVAIAHWPLASLRALGHRGDAVLQIVPDHGSDERLVLSDAEMIDAISQVCPELFRRAVDRRGIRRLVLWGSGALGSVLLIVFVLVPMLAGTLATMIPPEREQALGDTIADQILRLLSTLESHPVTLCSTPDGDAALAELSRRLTGALELRYPLRVDVVDHGLINALTLPGGRILVFRGLIGNADSPEEVAGVLAHEIGHVIHLDPTRTTLRAAGTAGILGLFLGDVFGASVVVAVSEAAMNASYQRDAEASADAAATAMLANAGLPSRPFAEFFHKMRRKYGDMPGLLRYFASHPDLAGRAERAAAGDSIGDGPYEPALSDQGWVALGNICD